MEKINLKRILAAEFYKSEKNAGLLLLLAFPIIITGFVFYAMYQKCVAMETSGSFFWLEYSDWHFMVYNLLYPLMVAVAVCAFYSVEQKANGFRYLFSLPVGKGRLYFADSLLLLVYLTFSLMLSYALLVLSGNVFSLIFPEMNIAAYAFRININMLYARTFISLLAVMALQLFLSNIFNSFIIPLCIAIMGTIAGMFLSNWKYAFLIPYGGIQQAMKWFYMEDCFLMHKETIAAVSIAFCFYMAGMLVFCKKGNYQITKKKNA